MSLDVIEPRPANIVEHTSGGAISAMEILGRAVDRGADIETIEKLMGLVERQEAREARRAFDEAMSLARAKLPVILKNRAVDYTNKSNERTNYKYEDLAEIAKTVGPILAEFGLSYRFRTSSAPNEPVFVTCIVSHRLGYSEENSLHGPRDDSGKKNSLQQIGSTLTYLQRMTLKAALGLASSADDDGKASGAGEDDGPITDDQLQALRKKIDDTGADVAKLCEYLKIEALPDLPKRRFSEAEATLNERARLIANKKAKPQ